MIYIKIQNIIYSISIFSFHFRSYFSFTFATKYRISFLSFSKKNQYYQKT